MGSEEVDKAEQGEENVPVRPVPRVQQGSQGQQREGQVHV